MGEDSLSRVNVFSLINSIENLTLVFYPMSDQISGMCVRVGDTNSLIAINSTSTYGRQRFTAAHELYHLNYQSDFKNVICSKDIFGKKDDEEKNADAFASYFLAPYESLKLFISETLKKSDGPIDLADIVKTEQHYGMSRQATLYRLQNENYITAESANNYKTNVTQSARKLGFNDKLYLPTPPDQQYLTTGNYVELVEKLKERGIISQGKYEEYLLEAYRSDIVYNTQDDSEEKYD